MVTTFEVPPGLAERASSGPEWATWLDRLPRLVADLVTEWGLRIHGPSWHGHGSVVVPVRTDDDVPAALKVAWDGDDEGLHEALALQHWHGNGTVQLLRADPHRRALLLERLLPRDLTSIDVLDACEVVAGLYPRLHVPTLPQLQTLTGYVERWLDDLAALGRDVPIPHRYVEQALSLGRDLVSDPASTGVIVHGDLHYENVLAGEREPWLVIDPKPMSGDPHYEVPPMLWNRWDELGPSVRDGLRDRFFTIVDAAGLDEDRARDWAIVRMVVDASWTVHDAQRLGLPLDADDRSRITQCISIVKAVQD